MNARLQPFALVDGAVVHPCISRRELVEQMAEDLIRFDAWRDERDAIRSLMWTNRYSSYDIMVLVDDVRQAAAQILVAREMSAP